MNRLGGRKFVLSLIAMLCITLLALNGADSAAFGSIALIVGAFAGANGYVEGRHAGKPNGN
jgi:hypothetical protein